ncbi:MAG: hypothetical protein AAGD11_18445 [Planctomycetota bacterium]
MTIRKFQILALCCCFLLLVGQVDAAESVVSNAVVADTWITFESDNASRADENHGGDQDLKVRSGNSSLTNAVRKPLIRFDITGQTINPSQLYIFEVTTESDGSSSSVHTINAITDPLLQNFEENTITWNLAPESAKAEVASFNSAGPAVGTFNAPGSPDTAIQTVMLGSDFLDAVFADGGSSLLTFGIGGSQNSTLELQSKESVQAVPAPARLLTFDLIESAASGGSITAGATWVGGAAPAAGNQYAVVNGDVVTADGGSAFLGEALIVSNGSLDYSASGVDLPLVVVSEGAAVTESTTGEFLLGDFNAPVLGQMVLNGNLTIDAEGGADAGLDMDLQGAGTAEVNVSAGGRLFITSLSSFGGTVQFNGSGDELLYEGPSGSTAVIEMNSTGTNTYAVNVERFGGLASNLVFNQPGNIDHRTDPANGNNRLTSVGTLTANADVTVDLTKTYAGNERRFFGSWSGSGNITVNGTATDPSAVDVSLNEFEAGTTDPESEGLTRLSTRDYSGTLTTNDFVNVEVRQHLPNAEIVVNQNAVLDVGVDGAVNLTSTRIGSVTVNNGGTLDVGHELTNDSGEVRRAPGNLQLTSQRSQSGDLTLNTGSTTVIQISGSGANQFDTISAEGTVSLGGTLELLIDPLLTSSTTLATEGSYIPTDGDTFEIVSIVAETLPTDLNADGAVDGDDLTILRELYGQSIADLNFDVTADIDGDGDTDGSDLLAWQRSVGATGALNGSITGDFDSINIVDPGGLLANFTVTSSVTATSVILTINEVPAIAAVPEPSAVVLLWISFAALLGIDRRGSLSFVRA